MKTVFCDTNINITVYDNRYKEAKANRADKVDTIEKEEWVNPRQKK